jgi:hypothetical protein
LVSNGMSHTEGDRITMFTTGRYDYDEAGHVVCRSVLNESSQMCGASQKAQYRRLYHGVLRYVTITKEVNIKLATRVGKHPPPPSHSAWLDSSCLFREGQNKTDLAWVGKPSGKKWMNQLKVPISQRSISLLSWVVNVSLTEAMHGAYSLSGSRPVCETWTYRVANKMLSHCKRIASIVLCDSNTVIPRLTSDPANEDFFRCFSDSADEYGFG